MGIYGISGSFLVEMSVRSSRKVFISISTKYFWYQSIPKIFDLTLKTEALHGMWPVCRAAHV